MKILRDDRSSVLTRHAGVWSVMTIAAIAIGVLLGVSAVEYQETASRWVLRT